MENRSEIHYQGNTVIAPHPSLDNIKRRIGKNWSEVKQMEFQPKVCATNKCIWCRVFFDNYQIKCNVCNSCQYCGMIMIDKHKCHLCGNYAPEELTNDTPIDTIKF